MLEIIRSISFNLDLKDMYVDHVETKLCKVCGLELKYTHNEMISHLDNYSNDDLMDAYMNMVSAE